MIAESQTDAAVKRIFSEIKFQEEPRGLYDPLRYMIGIGGKRIRPRLCLTAYGLFRDGFGEDVCEAAAALEVFHTFTLIHDDIMDRSPLRRGMTTVWKKWNEDTAILSGDVMQIDAYKRIAKVPSSVLPAVLELFSCTAAQVCDGQQMDMDFESRAEVPMPEYEKMIGLKTAVLLACSAKMGALVAGVSSRECDALYEYGYQLGMAFQVADDYLDAFGDEKVFGKPIGGDILNRKKSWLTVRAMEKESDKEAFIAAFEAQPETEEGGRSKIDLIRSRYCELGVDAEARAEIRRYTDLALKAVSGLSLGSLRTEVLRRFADSLVSRAV